MRRVRSFSRFLRRFAEPERGLRLLVWVWMSSDASGRQASGGWRRSVMDTRGPAQAETQCFAIEPEAPPNRLSLIHI